jgi:hypothetical protein
LNDDSAQAGSLAQSQLVLIEKGLSRSSPIGLNCRASLTMISIPAMSGSTSRRQRLGLDGGQHKSGKVRARPR